MKNPRINFRRPTRLFFKNPILALCVRDRHALPRQTRQAHGNTESQRTCRHLKQLNIMMSSHTTDPKTSTVGTSCWRSASARVHLAPYGRPPAPEVSRGFAHEPERSSSNAQQKQQSRNTQVAIILQYLSAVVKKMLNAVRFITIIYCPNQTRMWLICSQMLFIGSNAPQQLLILPGPDSVTTVCSLENCIKST